MHEARARALWRDEEWVRAPNPDQQTAVQVRDRIRGLTFRKGPGVSFLLAHPTIDSVIHAVHRRIMLRRHLGLPVYEDSLPRICEQCNSQMDLLGDHAANLCRSGFGGKHRHDTLHIVMASQVPRAAGLDCQVEAPPLVPGTELRQADILMHPPTAPDGSATRPIACNFTVTSMFREDLRTKATRTAGVDAEAAHRKKVTDLK
eukprot:GFKZ01006916.1.p1 GENE.GFKZ01006916.1~~GFKZ01006916.1.p1  ORF type:complete len:203 (-),score=5.57 GFKZ01006916.1:72-680(-)